MRIESWERYLNEYFETIHGKAFIWGDCDCLIFASDAVKVMTGIDPMSKKNKNDPDTIRGLYDSEESARDLIKLYRKSLRDIMDVHFERKDIAFCKRGDVVLYKNAFGIVAGRSIAFFKSEGLGLQIVKLEDCSLAWEV